MEAFLAQVLQRRHNHDTFDLVRVSAEKQPKLVEQLGVVEVPTLLIIDERKIEARVERPRGPRPDPDRARPVAEMTTRRLARRRGTLLGALVAGYEHMLHSEGQRAALEALVSACVVLAGVVDSDSLRGWNDVPGRTQADVLAALDEAATRPLPAPPNGTHPMN